MEGSQEGGSAEGGAGAGVDHDDVVGSNSSRSGEH